MATYILEVNEGEVAYIYKDIEQRINSINQTIKLLEDDGRANEAQEYKEYIELFYNDAKSIKSKLEPIMKNLNLA